jgi:hypothetical protein
MLIMLTHTFQFPSITAFVGFIATIKHPLELINRIGFILTGKFSTEEVSRAVDKYKASVSPENLNS